MARSIIGWTRGRLLLLAVLQRTTGVAVAARLRVSKVTVCQWANGDRMPSPHHRAELERNYGIPVIAWAVPVIRGHGRRAS
jgi:hypothetical protein